MNDVMAREAILPPASWPETRVRSGPDRLAYGALLAFLVVFILAPQERVSALEPLRLAFVAAVAAVGAYLFGRVLTDKPFTIRAPEIGLTAGLFAWATLTIPFSLWRGGSVEVLIGLFARTVIVFWLIANLVDTTARLRQIALALSLMTVPLAFTTIAHTVQGMAPGATRIEGYQAPLTLNPNDLALLLNVILPLTVALAIAPRPPLPRTVLWAICALSALGVILTFSRGGFLTLVATTACWLKRASRNRVLEIGLVVCVLVLLAIPFLPTGYLGHLETITDIHADTSGSAQERLRDMRTAAVYIVNHPVPGVGIGNNTIALNDARGTTWRMVHNVYLQVGVDLGVPGLVLIILLVRAARRSARDAVVSAEAAGHATLAILAQGVTIGLTGFLVASLFHPVAYHAYFYLLAALAVAARGLSARDWPEEAPA